MSADELADHKLWLETRYSSDPRGSRADLCGANLRGADLGAKTPLGQTLRLLGACAKAIEWIETQDQSSVVALLQSAHEDWRNWIAARGISIPAVVEKPKAEAAIKQAEGGP